MTRQQNAPRHQERNGTTFCGASVGMRKCGAVAVRFLVPFSTALAVMYGARENGTTTGVVSRSIFSCRSLAPENGTTVPYTSKKFAFRGSPARDRPTWMPGVARYEV
ncbi:hypothetical protein Tco_1245067 [Tanacetum coccineum]